MRKRSLGDIVGEKGSVGRRVRASPRLNTTLDAVPPVKTHIYLSNFYQLNGYSPESPTGGTRDF